MPIFMNGEKTGDERQENSRLRMGAQCRAGRNRKE